MIEFIRRSLIQKAIEGDMKILAAGSLSIGEDEVGDPVFDGSKVNFTLAEGKTTLIIASFIAGKRC